jgi:hypothetical protein
MMKRMVAPPESRATGVPSIFPLSAPIGEQASGGLPGQWDNQLSN